MKKLFSIIPLLIFALIFGFACTGTGLKVEATEPKPDIAATEQNSNIEIEKLIENLKDKDSKVRKKSAEALGSIGDMRAVEPLIEALKDEDENVRENAAKALGQIKDVKAVEPLIVALEDKDSGVRRYAAAALGNIGDAKAVESLIEALKVGDFYDITWGNAKFDEDAREAARDALVNIGEPAVESLIDVLKGEDSNIKKYAAMALGQIGDLKALEPLIKALSDEEDVVRFNAAQALINIGDSRAVGPLIIALDDEISGVRWSAAMALGNIGDTRAVEPLMEALGDKDDIVQANAANALGMIGEPAIDSLFKALEDINRDVRINAAKALGYINDPSVVEFLIGALKDKNLEIIAGAYSFFIHRGEEGTEAILIEALNKYGDKGMATSFLNCGNAQLEQAAYTWATSHGYTVTEFPIGGSGPTWGANK